MFSLNNIKINSLDELHNYVSDYDILSHYLGEIKDNLWIISPFRNEEHGSFRISFYNNKWVWTDFGLDSRPKDAITFCMLYEGLDFREALQFCYDNIKHSNTKPTVVKKSKLISCKISKTFSKIELDYWNQANITEEDLRFYNIYKGEIWFNKKLLYKSTDTNLLFIYLFDKENKIFKGYRPNETEYRRKFFSNNITDHLQGYDLLPETGDILIITKSYKDVIVWRKLGYAAIAPHTENCFINPVILADLKKRFKKIYVNYDNDFTGVNKSIEFTQQNDLNYFNLPTNTNAKDPFEFVVIDKNKNYNELNNLFKQKIKRDETM